MGFMRGYIITPEDAEIMAENWERERKELKEWRAKQPEFIAKEMTNREMVKELGLAEAKSATFGRIILVKCFLPSKDKIKIIDGIAYKKVKNPKIKGNKIIPWK